MAALAAFPVVADLLAVAVVVGAATVDAAIVRVAEIARRVGVDRAVAAPK